MYQGDDDGGDDDKPAVKPVPVMSESAGGSGNTQKQTANSDLKMVKKARVA